MYKSITLCCAVLALALAGSAQAEGSDQSNAGTQAVSGQQAMAPREAFGTVQGVSWVNGSEFVPGDSNAPEFISLGKNYFAPASSSFFPWLLYSAPFTAPVGSWLDSVDCYYKMLNQAPQALELYWRRIESGSAQVTEQSEDIGYDLAASASSYPSYGVLSATAADPQLMTHAVQGPNPQGRRQVHAIQLIMDPAYAIFGCEVHWHREMSPAPATASFGDVPSSSSYFQAVEALAASGVTAGCGDGSNFCPDEVVTRKQMAVFLAKALGLSNPQ